MEQIQQRKGAAWRWLAAVIGPFALLSGYCVLKHRFLFPLDWDFGAPILFALAGAALVVTLPRHSSSRILLFFTFTAVGAVVLFFYGFIFYGYVYQLYP